MKIPNMSDKKQSIIVLHTNSSLFYKNDFPSILKELDEPLAKLHQSSRRQSSCLTNAVIF